MPPRSTAVAERPRQAEPEHPLVPIKDALKDQGGAIHAFLPNEEVRNRFLRVVTQAVQKNPDLMACTPESIASAAVEAAMYGLEPSGAAGGAHLVPFRKNVGTKERARWVSEAQLVVDYRGQMQLARDSEKVEDAFAVIVRKADRFRYDAANQRIEHEPDLSAAQSPNPDDAANPMTHVYAVVVFRSGYRRPEVMSKAQVDAVRAMSKAANGPAWRDSYLEMAKKTVLHRALKTAPLKPGARAILERDPDFDFDGARATVEPVNGAQPRLADRLRTKRLGTSEQPGQDETPASSRPAPACTHPAAKHENREVGVVCTDCGTVLAERDQPPSDGAAPEAATATPARRRRGGPPQTDKAVAGPSPRRRTRTVTPKTPDEEGYHRARAHALAAERGLDPDALKRIAGDVLGYEGEWSRTAMVEADWEQVASAINGAPVSQENAEAWDDAATTFACIAAINAGVVPKTSKDPWGDGIDDAAADLLGTPVDDFTPSAWVEYGLRALARKAR